MDRWRHYQPRNKPPPRWPPSSTRATPLARFAIVTLLRQQLIQIHRAESHAQPANGQEDECSQCGTHDEHPVELVKAPLTQPIVAQLLFYIPPSNAAVYHPVLPQYEPFVPVVQDHGGFAGPEYIHLVEYSTLWNPYGNQSRGEGQRGTGEPHEGTRDNAPLHVVSAKEDHCDVHQNCRAEESIQHEHYGQLLMLGNHVH
ncbi:hypothetical protein MRX96_003326 [Rhipicephalus microplus]